MRHLILCVELGFAACLAAAALAQAPAPSAPADRPTAAPARENPLPTGRADKILVGCLIIDNQGEVQMARFAAGRAQHPEVKKFAEKMAAEHTECITKLHTFLGEQPKAAAAPPADAAPQPNSPIAAPKPAAEAHFDHMALKRELGEQCVKSTQAELGKKQGSEFDQCYMTHQIMMHQHMLDTLTVFSRHASPDLQAALREGQQKTQEHMTHAKKIFEQLDTDPPAATARRPGAEPAPRDR